MAEQAAGELTAGGMVVDGKPSPWFTIHQQATKALALLAMRLRLSLQARAKKRRSEVSQASRFTIARQSIV